MQPFLSFPTVLKQVGQFSFVRNVQAKCCCICKWSILPHFLFSLFNRACLVSYLSLQITKVSYGSWSGIVLAKRLPKSEHNMGHCGMLFQLRKQENKALEWRTTMQHDQTTLMVSLSCHVSGMPTERLNNLSMPVTQAAELDFRLSCKVSLESSKCVAVCTKRPTSCPTWKKWWGDIFICHLPQMFKYMSNLSESLNFQLDCFLETLESHSFSAGVVSTPIYWIYKQNFNSLLLLLFLTGCYKLSTESQRRFEWKRSSEKTIMISCFTWTNFHIRRQTTSTKELPRFNLFIFEFLDAGVQSFLSCEGPFSCWRFNMEASLHHIFPSHWSETQWEHGTKEARLPSILFCDFSSFRAVVLRSREYTGCLFSPHSGEAMVLTFFPPFFSLLKAWSECHSSVCYLCFSGEFVHLKRKWEIISQIEQFSKFCRTFWFTIGAGRRKLVLWSLESLVEPERK